MAQAARRLLDPVRRRTDLYARLTRIESAVEGVRKAVGALEKRTEMLARAQADSEIAVEAPLDYPAAGIRLVARNRHERKRASAVRKEPWTVAWIESLPAGAVLWDIGANVGAYSLIAAMRPQGPLRVVAVEPSAATYASLVANVVHNGVCDRVTPLGVLLADRTGLGSIGLSDVGAGAAFHEGGGTPLRPDAPVVYEQPILAYTVDDLVDRMGLPAPEYVKLDVDGAEAAVLRGATRSLAGVRGLLVEISDAERDEVAALLAGAGLAPRPDEQRRTDAEGNSAPVAYTVFERS